MTKLTQVTTQNIRKEGYIQLKQILIQVNKTHI